VIAGTKAGLCNLSGVVYSIAPVSNATSYIWTVNVAGATLTGQGTNSIAVSFPSFTSGSVTVQAVNGCGTSAVRSVTVLAAPGTPGPISGLTNVCTGSTQQYSVSTVANTQSYNWTVTFGGTIISGQGTKDIGIQWSANPLTAQNISVRAANACGTSAIRSLSGISVVSCARQEITESTLDMMVYPNPAHDIINLRFTGKEGEAYTVQLTDVSGRAIQAGRGIAKEGLNTGQFILGDLSSGIYFLTLTSGDQQQTMRLMVE
jgi:hypothetical protein